VDPSELSSDEGGLEESFGSSEPGIRERRTRSQQNVDVDREKERKKDRKKERSKDSEDCKLTSHSRW